VGNEGAGLSDALINAATLQVSIPLSAGIESLNAAIATAIILYEAKRQRNPMTRVRP
jgi:RNA methyltransferase, TrmH family